ncbi:MAG: deoxyribodipyrimidine photo-lyase [Roseiflexaceae bacterium]|nr:DNA photolyase family protein [Roseiflexus sp.]MDW8213005.1 deoxyribodipyrimidine photo-lyase [Roseiflexaceae bacterium]
MIWIHWFRRDLRLRDNPALAAAAARSDGCVIPLFILDDAILHAPRIGAARIAFMIDALRNLDASLRARASRLVVRRGRTLDVIRDLVRDTGAAGVAWNRDYTPFARQRDAQVEAMLRDLNVETLIAEDAVILGPDDVRTSDGRPYTVYTPYWRRWRTLVDQRRAEWLREVDPLLRPVSESIADLAIPDAADLGVTVSQRIPPGGETPGNARLAAFVDLTAEHSIAGYAEGRNLLAEPATSRLSPYLRFGCVAPRAALRVALRLLDEVGGDPKAERTARSIETWIGELAWRDFYYQILWHYPHVLRNSFKAQYDALAWENDPALFDAWKEGRTGYPIVDAAMRQLNQEAWMHNRARMIVASFLTKDLLIDWRWGERYFMQQLVDGDHAANNGGWQWSASTGTDAQPYFRIFNPVSQGQKFDPKGEYVRRYLPELAQVPDRYIHAPWTMPRAEQQRCGVVIGRDYPAPIVDHAERRMRALALYRAASSVAL